MSRVGRSSRVRRVVVVGAGIAGAMAAVRLCELGVPVALLSHCAPQRTSACTSLDGLAAALPGHPRSGTPLDHAEDALHGGADPAERALLLAMAEAAPDMVLRLGRYGVPWDRTAEGNIALGASIGSRARRTASAGDTTGAQVLRALQEQVLRYANETAEDARGMAVSGEPCLQALWPWSLLDLVLDDDGVVVGVVAEDLTTGRIQALSADAVCLATGGAGALLGHTHGPLLDSGVPTAVAIRHGAAVCRLNQIHQRPLAVSLPQGHMVFPESVLLSGARLWTLRGGRASHPREVPETERFYPLEARDSEVLSVQDVLDVLPSRGAEPAGYLELSSLVRGGRFSDARHRLRQLTDIDAAKTPIPVTPVADDTLGGLWVRHVLDSRGQLVSEHVDHQATSLRGLYAAGAIEASRARALPDDSLLAGLHAGWLAAGAMRLHAASLRRPASALPASVFERAEKVQEGRRDAGQDEGENPFLVLDALTRTTREVLLGGDVDTFHVLAERIGKCQKLAGPSAFAYSSIVARQLDPFLLLGRAALACRKTPGPIVWNSAGEFEELRDV